MKTPRRRVLLVFALTGALAYLALKALGVPGPDFRSAARAIKGRGEITGEAFPFDKRVPFHLQIFPRVDTDRSVPAGPPGTNRLFPGMTDRARAQNGDIGVSPHAFLLRNGAQLSLGTLGGAYSAAFALSDGGWAAGVSRVGAGARTEAVLWRPDGTKTALGTLGGSYSQALGLNNQGHVMGWSENARGERRAFLWQKGKMTDLNEMIPPADRDVRKGWTLVEAWDINDAGQIVGVGFRSGQDGVGPKEHGFVRTPTVRTVRPAD